MELLKDFGFDPILLTAQIINFLIILVVLKKFMYKPVLDMLKNRENEIKKGLKDSEDAQKRLEDAEEKEKQILQKARAEADKMVTDAKNEADALKAEKLEQTRIEVEKIIESGRATIALETKEAEDRLTGKIGTIAIALLEKSLAGIFGEKEQKEILKKATLQIQKNS